MTEQEQKLLDELAVKNEKRLYDTAFLIVKDAHIAQDVVQEAYRIACARIKTVMTHENPVGWLCVTVRNVAKRELRRAHHRLEILEDEIEVMGDTDVELAAEHLLPTELLPEERDLILMRIEKGMSFEEIARLQGIKPDTCRQQFYRALSRCKELL